MRDERGFALIAALWLVVMITTVGMHMSLEAKDRRLSTANAIEFVRAKAAAEAGVEHARARLEQLMTGSANVGLVRRATGDADPWFRPGLLFSDTMTVGEARYAVTLRDVGQALNINRATQEELTRLLRALRVDFGEAERVAHAIMDWRDPDDEYRARGAERDDYLSEGAAVLPRNGPFQALAELRYVRGVDDELFDLVEPYLTTLGTGRVNINAAPAEVLLALEGMSDVAVSIIIRSQRQGRRFTSLNDLAQALPGPARRLLATNTVRLSPRTMFETSEVEVMSVGWLDGSPVRATVQGMLVRAGEQAFLTWKKVR